MTRFPRFFGIALLFFLLFWGKFLVYGQSADRVFVEADHIVFEEGKSSVYASENVVLRYRFYDVDASYIYFDYNKEQLQIPREFVVKAPSINFSADQLVFSFRSKMGQAGRFSGYFDRLRIRGSSVLFEPDKVVIKGGSFTTCDNHSRFEKEHYHVVSDRIVLYPEDGFFVAFGNSLHSRYLPFPIWIPTYTHGNTGAARGGVGTAIPEVGSNRREGWYVSQKVGYFLDKKSSGLVDIGTTERLGLKLGVDHGYLLDKTNSFRFKVYSNGTDGYSGGVSYFHDMFFGQEETVALQEDEVGALFNQFQLPDGMRGRLSIYFLMRELVNDSRVDYMPMVTYSLSDAMIGSDWIFSSTAGYAHLVEDSLEGVGHQESRWQLDPVLHRRFDLSRDWALTNDWLYYGKWYSRGYSWQRGFVRVGIEWNWPVLNPKLSYAKRLFSSGGSPFIFEQQFALEHDELGLYLSTAVNGLELGMELAYDLEDQGTRVWDWIAGFDVHCFKVKFRWQTVQRNFRFGIEVY